jgi:uncharacterized protein
MLRLDIGSVPEGISHADLSEDASDWVDPPEGGRLEGQVRVGLDVTRNGQDLYLRGTAGVRAVLECGRCLDEYTCTLKAPIEIWVIVRGTAGSTLSEDRENIIEVQTGERYADLTDNVRSELLLQMPLKQVCRPDCKGLCPVCGTNLNTGRCECREKIHDSRWDALKDLKKML